MKNLLITVALMFSANAFAVDMVLTFTPALANRLAAACGNLNGLADAQAVPRSCTVAEAKAFTIERLRRIVLEVERTIANQAARDAIVIQPFDPQ